MIATPSRRKRLVIAESPSSESNFEMEEDEDDESEFSPPKKEEKKKTQDDIDEIERVLEQMSEINLSANIVADSDDELAKRKDSKKDSKTKSSPKFQRFARGLDSVSFDSDSCSESDSELSFGIPPSVFQPRRQATFEDSFDSAASDDDDSFQTAKEEVSCFSDSDDEDDLIEKRGRWKYNKSRNELYLSSTAEVKIPELAIPSKLFKTLFDYQKEGVAWMAGLHNGRIGGLLGDDMGLGKTYQVLAFLGGMMRSGTIRNSLVVAPLSVLRSWEREANKVAKACVPRLRIQVVSSDISKTVRSRRLQESLDCGPNQPSLVITTYGLVRSSTMDFVNEYSKWDYVVLDEAHMIKNPSAELSKCCRRIARDRDTRKLILTGTPIMNNLKELWALFDFAQSGKVLGPMSRFMNSYAKPIEDSRNSDATSHEMRIGERARKDLQEKLRLYFLQRTKLEYLADKLPKKSDYVVWVGLSSEQREMYSEYVESKDSAVAHVLSGISTSPLEAIAWLKKLCGHPILVQHHVDSKRVVNKASSELLKSQSSKLFALSKLVDHLCSRGHKTLIFSQSTNMLDIIERILQGVNFLRIDGSTKEKERQRRVDDFNSAGGKIEVMLLSTKAAGVGLTLTGADRAIIYDPSWNPAEDAQAVDRCYRIGQTKEVTVFRFITAGTVEEKMYEKQVHKDGIRRAVMTSVGSATTRYFDKGELRKVFKLGAEGICEFLDRLKQRGIAKDDDLAESSMITHPAIIGVSSHDKIYLSDSTVTIDGDIAAEDKNENPFGTANTLPAPPRPSNSIRNHNHDPSPRILGRSQRALLKGPKSNNEKSQQHNRNQPPDFAEKENLQKTTNAISTASGAGLKSVSKCDDVSTATLLIQEVDRLCNRGAKVEAMEILMDLLQQKSIEVGNAAKIEVHKRVARVANELRWL